MKARAEINLWFAQAGDVVDVDAADADMQVLLRGGLLTRMEQSKETFCLRCDPPTFYASEEDLGQHVADEHEGVGDGATG